MVRAANLSFVSLLVAHLLFLSWLPVASAWRITRVDYGGEVEAVDGVRETLVVYDTSTGARFPVTHGSRGQSALIIDARLDFAPPLPLSVVSLGEAETSYSYTISDPTPVLHFSARRENKDAANFGDGRWRPLFDTTLCLPDKAAAFVNVTWRGFVRVPPACEGLLCIAGKCFTDVDSVRGSGPLDCVAFAFKWRCFEDVAILEVGDLASGTGVQVVAFATGRKVSSPC